MINKSILFLIVSLLLLIGSLFINIYTEEVSVDKVEKLEQINQLSKYSYKHIEKYLKTYRKNIKVSKTRKHIVLEFHSSNKIYVYKVIQDLIKENIYISKIEIENNKKLKIKLYIDKEE